MTYSYPKICSCLIFKRYNNEYVAITDYLTNEVYYLGIDEVRYAKQLDGKTDPYDIETDLSEQEIDFLIEELFDCGLIRGNNKTKSEDGTVLRTVWEPKWTPLSKLIAVLCNNLLIISWLPMLIIGILMTTENFISFDYELMWIGTLIGVIVGIVLHEFGHAFAGVAYGARVFEMGILTMFYIMPGAYVIMDNSNVKNRLKRVQILAAGVEVNLLLAGVFLIMASIFPGLGGMFLAAGIQNLVIALLNLTLIRGLDGMAIVSELFGVEDFVNIAKEIILDRKKRKSLGAMGTSGGAMVTACYMICVFQLTFPILMLLNVLEVVAWFI